MYYTTHTIISPRVGYCCYHGIRGPRIKQLKLQNGLIMKSPESWESELGKFGWTSALYVNRDHQRISWFRPPGWVGHKTGGILPVNKGLRKVRAFRELPEHSPQDSSSIFPLQTPTMVNSRWLYRYSLLLSIKRYTESWQQMFVYVQALTTITLKTWISITSYAHIELPDSIITVEHT